MSKPNTQSPNVPRKSSGDFPFAMILRWVISGGLVVIGLWRLFLLINSWSYWSDRAIIDMAYSPYPWLLVEMCVAAAGVLLYIRSKWVFAAVLGHVLLFNGQLCMGLNGAPLPLIAYEIWACEALVLWFCASLLLAHRLR
jgi:hypothetical protein